MIRGIPSFMVSSIGASGTTGTIWDVSTASYDSIFLDVSSNGAAPTSLFMKSDGTTLYVVSNTDKKIYQWTLSSPYDLSSATYASKYYDSNVWGTTPSGMYISDDGLILYTFDYSSFIMELPMSVAWDISTAKQTGGYPSYLSTSGQLSTGGNGFSLGDLTKMYYASVDHNSIFQYNFGTPGDITTASYSGNTYGLSSEITANHVSGLFCTSDGQYIYAGSYDSPYKLFQYILGTPGDLSTASYTGKSFNYNSQLTFCSQLFFAGTKMYLSDFVNSKIFQYSVSFL